MPYELVLPSEFPLQISVHEFRCAIPISSSEATGKPDPKDHPDIEDRHLYLNSRRPNCQANGDNKLNSAATKPMD
jgi:hypothetical protein